MDPERQVLYKGAKKLGHRDYAEDGGYFMVEVSKNMNLNRLYVAAFDISSPESLLIKLIGDKVAEIEQQFDNDYEKIANCLQVFNKRLVLLNPKYVFRSTQLDSMNLPATENLGSVTSGQEQLVDTVITERLE